MILTIRAFRKEWLNIFWKEWLNIFYVLLPDSLIYRKDFLLEFTVALQVNEIPLNCQYSLALLIPATEIIVVSVRRQVSRPHIISIVTCEINIYWGWNKTSHLFTHVFTSFLYFNKVLTWIEIRLFLSAAYFQVHFNYLDFLECIIFISPYIFEKWGSICI